MRNSKSGQHISVTYRLILDDEVIAAIDSADETGTELTITSCCIRGCQRAIRWS